MVGRAVAQAGGLDFIKDGNTVVLKPNLASAYVDRKNTVLDLQANGISADWRVVKAVADLVRAKDPTGKILVMEGSTVPTNTAFSLLGYSEANFGSSVDEFIAFEGSSCVDRDTTALVQKTAANGKVVWVNQRYFSADVVISIPTMKTHNTAGITGAVKNLGIGTTPTGQYSQATSSNDCTRAKTPDYIDHSTAETLGQFIHDNFSIRPADFAVMDALQGIQNGPNPVWVTGDAGTGNYANDKKNMRLILASKNAVALDTIAALVMKCDPKQVPHLTKLEADGFGTTDITRITVVGKQVGDVQQPFVGPKPFCPGT
jgi:uncharacterized protein (DUF362 family)